MAYRIAGVVVAVFAIGSAVMARQSPDSMWITIRSVDGSASASVMVTQPEIYVDRPTAGVGPAVPHPGNAVPELMFTIRSWREADAARVVVFARLQDERAPTGRTETPIATFRMHPGETVDVTESQAWGGPRYVVSAETR